MAQSYKVSVYHNRHGKRYDVEVMANDMEDALTKAKLHYPSNRDYSGHCVFNPDHLQK